MNPRFRLILFLAGAAALGAIYLGLARQIPGPEALRSRYLAAINHTTVRIRNATDAVSAVNFDYRGFDTLGEEFILFVSVAGATVLLRQAEEKPGRFRRDACSAGRDVRPSDALRLWILLFLGPKLVLGWYLVTHGQLTPGGGFQGGVVLATAVLVCYIAEGFPAFRRVVPHALLEWAGAAGVAGYLLVGLIGLIPGREFLTNVLPLGSAGQVDAAGTMPWISFATGLEVAAGFTLLLFGFLQEALVPREDEEGGG